MSKESRKGETGVHGVFSKGLSLKLAAAPGSPEARLISCCVMRLKEKEQTTISELIYFLPSILFQLLRGSLLKLMISKAFNTEKSRAFEVNSARTPCS